MVKNNFYQSLNHTSIYKKPLIVVASTFFFITLIAFNSDRKLIVYNYTNSIPKGFYKLTKYDAKDLLNKMDLIVFDVPMTVKEMVNERHWLNKNYTLTKPVTAVHGDFVCTLKRIVKVNNISYGRIDSLDSMGREMPWFKYCSHVKKNTIFVFTDNSKSFDSRYFGAIKTNDVIAKAKPLWIF